MKGKDLIKERHGTHGPWNKNMIGSVIINDALIRFAEINLGRPANEVERGALGLAGNKIARMMVGDYTFDDHYDDFRNYIRFYREAHNTHNING